MDDITLQTEAGALHDLDVKRALRSDNTQMNDAKEQVDGATEANRAAGDLGVYHREGAAPTLPSPPPWRRNTRLSPGSRPLAGTSTTRGLWLWGYVEVRTSTVVMRNWSRPPPPQMLALRSLVATSMGRNKGSPGPVLPKCLGPSPSELRLEGTGPETR